MRSLPNGLQSLTYFPSHESLGMRLKQYTMAHIYNAVQMDIWLNYTDFMPLLVRSIV